MAICSAGNPNMLIFYSIPKQQKRHIFAFKFFNKKTILNLKCCIYSRRQAFYFSFSKKICHQSFNGLNNYLSIGAMLANPQILLYLTERNSWEIRHFSGMQHNLPPFHVFFISCVFYKCRASQFYQQNIAPIAFFRSQISSKLPW